MTISNLMSKKIFKKYLPPVKPKFVSKLKVLLKKNFLKFGTLDMSNMSISSLISKIIFIKYLPPVRHKLVPKLKILKIYRNLPHLIFPSVRLN